MFDSYNSFYSVIYIILKVFTYYVHGTSRTLESCPSPVLKNLVLSLCVLRINLMKALVRSAYQCQWVCKGILLLEVRNVALHSGDMLC